MHDNIIIIFFQLEEIRNKERHLSDLLFRHRPQQGSRRSERDLLLGGSDGGVANLGTVGWGAADEGSALQEEEEEGGEEGAKMKSQVRCHCRLFILMEVEIPPVLNPGRRSP